MDKFQQLKEKVQQSLDAAIEVLKHDNSAYFAGRVIAYRAVMMMIEELEKEK